MRLSNLSIFLLLWLALSYIEPIAAQDIYFRFLCPYVVLWKFVVFLLHQLFAWGHKSISFVRF